MGAGSASAYEMSIPRVGSLRLSPTSSRVPVQLDCFHVGRLKGSEALFHLTSVIQPSPRLEMDVVEYGWTFAPLQPGPLGVAAVETATIDLVEEEAGWLANARFVLNRCRGDSFLGVDLWGSESQSSSKSSSG